MKKAGRYRGADFAAFHDDSTRGSDLTRLLLETSGGDPAGGVLGVRGDDRLEQKPGLLDVAHLCLAVDFHVVQVCEVAFRVHHGLT